MIAYIVNWIGLGVSEKLMTESIQNHFEKKPVLKQEIARNITILGQCMFWTVMAGDGVVKLDFLNKAADYFCEKPAA